MTILRLLRRPSGSAPPTPPATPKITQGVLGCGEYKVAITTRGGGATVLFEVPFGQLKYGRVLTGTSDASVQIDGLRNGLACQTILSVADSWAYELAIFRSNSLVWCGPIVKRTLSGGDSLVIEARDLSAWLSRWCVLSSLAFTQADVATIWLATIAAANDATAGIVVSATATGVLADRSVAATDDRYAIDEVTDLTRLGIDWTTIGRNLLGGGLVVPAAKIATLLDEHFVGVPTIVEDGTGRATRVIVHGAQPRDATNGQFTSGVNYRGVASSAAMIATYGRQDVVSQDDSIVSSALAATSAANRLALSGPPVIALSGDQVPLTDTAPVTIDALIPGARVAASLTRPIIQFVGDCRLAQVSVDVTPGKEAVSIGLQPVGATS